MRTHGSPNKITQRRAVIRYHLFFQCHPRHDATPVFGQQPHVKFASPAINAATIALTSSYR
jgi:hypothetical protein